MPKYIKKDFTQDEIETLMWDLKEVVPEAPFDQSRWVTYWSKVVYEPEEDTYYKLCWCVGSTENQEVDLKLEVTQVEPVEVMTTVYKEIKGD